MPERLARSSVPREECRKNWKGDLQAIGVVKAVRTFARLESENEYGGLNRKSPVGSHIQTLGHQ